MSNFDFLKDFDEKLYRIGLRIEKEMNVSPSGVFAESTRFLEHLLKQLLTIHGFEFNSRKDFYDQLETLRRSRKITYNYGDRIYSAYKIRNKIHEDIDQIEKSEKFYASQLYRDLHVIAKKYYKDYNDNRDRYKGVPQFKPIELNTIDDEIDLSDFPKFSQINDITYDKCVICGEPNPSDYSLCCHKCNRKMDNANNLISIINAFEKEESFTKEMLMEFGIPEGYATQLILSLSQENVLKVTARKIRFNRPHFKQYFLEIEKYIAICELITKFNEDEILPSEIKRTKEYRLGSKKQEPYSYFYNVIGHEIINKFERDILGSEDIWESIEYTTITQKQLESWYLKNLNKYKKGIINESFVAFNNILMSEYIEYKKQGMNENEINEILNISPQVYEFWTTIRDSFEDELTQIKKDLILNAIKEGKTEEDAIDIAGVSKREFDNILKVAEYHNDSYADEINREFESRKMHALVYLPSNDLKTSCRYANITVDAFYNWYETSKENSRFYLESTEIFMNKYLDERRKGMTKDESLKATDLKEHHIKHWFSRTSLIHRKFRDTELNITIDLVLRGFKWDKTKEEIAKMADVDLETVNRFIMHGERDINSYNELFEYYENEVIPRNLNKFLNENANKPLKKALDHSDLTEAELNRYYELGKEGDERFADFYREFLDIKQGLYIYQISKNKSHKIAMKESYLTQEEYEENKEELDDLLLNLKFNIVLEAVRNKKKSNVAASKARCSVDDIYEWYFKGRDGDEKFEMFYEQFHKAYVRPSIVPIQEKLDSENISIDNLIRSNKHLFTKKDFDIWLKHDLITIGVFHLESEDEEEEEDSKSDKEEVVDIKLKKTIVKNNRDSLGRVYNDFDVEKLKKQILKNNK